MSIGQLHALCVLLALTCSLDETSRKMLQLVLWQQIHLVSGMYAEGLIGARRNTFFQRRKKCVRVGLRGHIISAIAVKPLLLTT